MIVFRLTKKKYKNDLSGIGAELSGGRWNSKGNRIVYTGSNRALCIAEVAVHLPLGIVPKDYMLQIIQLPNVTIQEVKIKDLPKSWKLFPHQSKIKAIGDKFLQENRKLILKVPSAVVQGESNYLLNPKHKFMEKVELKDVEPFKFDDRLF